MWFETAEILLVTAIGELSVVIQRMKAIICQNWASCTLKVLKDFGVYLKDLNIFKPDFEECLYLDLPLMIKIDPINL